MMKKLLAIGLLGLGLAQPAFANDQIEQVLQKQVQKQLESCVDGIVQVEEFGNRYFVAYHTAGSYDTSFGCSGNGSSPHLAELAYNNGRYSVVNVDAWENNNMAAIESMEISDDGIATLNALAYGRNDSQHYPRDKYRTKIRLVDMKVLSSQFVGRAPAND